MYREFLETIDNSVQGWSKLNKLKQESSTVKTTGAPTSRLRWHTSMRTRKEDKHIFCQIFNCCVRIEYFPKPWKEGTVVILPKPGKNLKIPINHRSTFLLNTMGKLLRKRLNRLNIHIMLKIRPEQFGFCEHDKTTIQLLNVIDGITNNLNRRHKAATSLLDIEKVFDKVWHYGLLFKLLAMDIPN